MENFISKCLDSLLVPNIDKLDILVINDGSKDRSSEIAHEYEKRFQESIRVIDKENANYGSCINVGLPLCKGKYIKILDADDTFDTSNLEKFVNLLQKCNADLVLTDYITVNKNNYVINNYKSKEYTPNTIYNIEKLNGRDNPLIALHSFTYKSSIFNKLNYYQSLGIPYTDNEWIFIPIINCKNFIYFDLIIYNYLIERTGQTINKKIWLTNLDSYQKIIERLLNDYTDYIFNKNNIKYFNDRINIMLHLLYKSTILEKNLLKASFINFHEQIKQSPEIYERLVRDSYVLKGCFNWIIFWDRHRNNKRIELQLLKIYLKIKFLLNNSRLLS